MKKDLMIVLTLITVVVLVPFASSGLADIWNKLTGEATSTTFTQNITVAAGNAPVVYNVMNESMTDISSGPTEDSETVITINFSVSDAQGYGNLNDATAYINFNLSTVSRNASCTRYEQSGNYANYTCDVSMWWFDGTGTWGINASISDSNGNYAQNITDTFSVGTTAGFESSPSSLSWSSINPGAVDTEPSNNILMNNTGNLVRNVEVNATDLLGEDTPSEALWAANFSAHTASGCGGTAMVADTYTDVSGASLPIGNYTIDDATGQEQIYVCLEAANADLSAQSYSTAAEGSWTVRIVS